MEDYQSLMIQYKIKGLGNCNDIIKRNNILFKIHLLLEENQLGFGEGGGLGIGIMDIICYVKNKEIAIPLIKESLINSEYSDFHRIV